VDEVIGMPRRSDRHGPSWKTAAVLGAVALFAGMLFWTKLRLVSDIPRSAYAVPKDEAPPSATEPEPAVDPMTPTERD
jgi:hypothetical protein